MPHVRSADGTALAYTRAGSGPAVVLVGGSLDDGAENAPLAAELASSCTVVNYARRGRGASGPWSAPHDVRRELEDLAAMIDLAGGAATLYGVSSGGALVLRAALAQLPGIERVGVYDVPFGTAPWWDDAWRAYRTELDELLAAGRESDALALFMRFAGIPDDAIAAAQADPGWADHARRAPTLAWDAAVLGDGRIPDGLATLDLPALVLTGGDGGDFFGPAADALAAALPNARRVAVPGQGHVADPAAIAPLITGFLSPR